MFGLFEVTGAGTNTAPGVLNCDRLSVRQTRRSVQGVVASGRPDRIEVRQRREIEPVDLLLNLIVLIE